MFIDHLRLKLQAGKGGNGVVTWRRERYLPKGGPTGGNGGDGGDLILQANKSTHSLEDLRSRRLVRGENGRTGGPNRQRGRNGRKTILNVPCGTLVKDKETGEILADLTNHGEQWILKGGRGGRGNASFASSRNRAPIKWTPGKEGQEAEVELELKLIADVGLVGYPNAGKSTLVNALTDVPVKMAPYPFTTLRPHLGYLRLPDYRRLLIADIPGLIEGASDNRGLGHKFLRHVERTNQLIFVLDASGIDDRTPTDDYAVLLKELEKYDPELLNRPRLVLLNKIDEAKEELVKEFHKVYPHLALECSALTGEGLDRIVELLDKDAS